uniref:Peptidase S1 domain-containing protein n=1 Tax=Trichuris muris TaxID=70415 RepID=A0A5S6Q196_TRIMR
MRSRLGSALLILTCSAFQFSSICGGQCGQPYFMPLVSTENFDRARIINGIEARKHSHPWQARIVTEFGEEVQVCGGTLIDWYGNDTSDLILTAAHCIMDTKVLEARYQLIEEIKFHFRRWRKK